MRVVFVHGWSVIHTNTYGGLPKALADLADQHGLEITTQHLQLAKYVSFADEVTVEDIARGMEHAVREEILPRLGPGERFACITHSTGGPVVREWIHVFHQQDLRRCPLSHLIMLAPANHGSALAQLGKGRISRLKSLVTEGVEPGTGVLNWLELGSDASWALNEAWLDYDYAAARFFPVVLSGQTIDRKFYDNLNSYTGEPGSDGVVRLTAANLNYGLLELAQNGRQLELKMRRRSVTSAFGVLPGQAHSGKELGIMRSINTRNAPGHPTVEWVFRSLKIKTAPQYRKLITDLKVLTDETQKAEKETTESGLFLRKRTFRTSRYCMLVIRIRDDRGTQLNDYEVLFTAGPDYNPNHLPPGFFVDRQRNKINPGKLTYYLDFDCLANWFGRSEIRDHFGVKVVVRPNSGFAFYDMAEFQGTFSGLRELFDVNETLMMDITMHRTVTEGVFRLTNDLTPQKFSKQKPGETLPDDI